jgi:ferredoxin--NADP+ reductase
MSTADSSAYNAVLAGREEINARLLVMRIQPDAVLSDFKPGQSAILGLMGREARVPEAEDEEPPSGPDQMIPRVYSIASSSVEKRYLEFYVNLITSGQLTPRLFALPNGHRLYLSRKAGGIFTLDRVPPGKAALLVATGTGIAPYMSMLRTMLVTDTSWPYVVLHGARHSWDLGYRAELETLARLRPNLTYIPSITRPDEDPHFRGKTGRIQSLLANGIIETLSGVQLDPSKCEIFLSGNPDMIRAAEEMLGSRGFKPGQDKEPGTIHFEEYW